MELNYKEFGQGPPVIILHGLLGMLDNWQSIARKLSEEYTVFIIDQRNHGKSPHEEVMNYELMAEDLRVFVEEHWIHRTHLLGHSMGGKAAMHFAIANPDMVEKLIVLDIDVSESQPGHEHIFQALFSLEPGSIDSRKEADEHLKKLIPEFRIRQFLLKNLGRNGDGALKWKMNLKAIYENYHNMLAGVPDDDPFEGPTLFIKGGNSYYLKEEDIVGIQKIFPNAQMSTVKGAGHWVHAEAPEEFLKLVRKFLSEGRTIINKD